MRIGHLILVLLLGSPLAVNAQSELRAPYQIYGGFAGLSNSINGIPGAHQPLYGWNAGVAFPDWHHLRFKLDYSMFRGENLGAQQHPYFILGGGQYEASFHRERIFAEALLGEAGMNRSWTPNGGPGGTASFAVFLGGGLDTSISRHFAFRVEGGMQHTNFNPIHPVNDRPYYMEGIPNYFGRFSAGLVWLPRVEPRNSSENPHTPPESEIIFEGLHSFGHMKIFASSKWTDTNVAGIEYDRHSWGTFLGARSDYVAEILPVLILLQPATADVWGNPKTKERERVPGLGISPIGIRLLWRDGSRIKPYFLLKAGMAGFTEKTFSPYASYENFTLQQGVGLQFALANRWDIRTGYSIFHASNGFVVPNNPGMDDMSVNAGVAYHLGPMRRAAH